jgi:hypothetical protein
MKIGRLLSSFVAIFLVLIIILSVFTILTPVFSVEDAPEKQEELEETRQDVTGIGFIPVNVNLKEGYGLSPREPLATDYDLEQACPNGYVGDGLFGLGIITLFGHVHWKTVGVWKTNELRTDLVLSGKIKYSLWLYQKQYNQDGDFRITLMNNDKEIAGTSKEYHNFIVEENNPKELVIEFDAGGNLTPLQPGDVLSLKIECRIQSGAYLYYGGPTFKSGVSLTCNSLRVQGLRYEREEKSIVAMVSDAFGISPALLNPTILIDDMPVDLDYNLGIDSETFNWQLVYYMDLMENLGEGEHVATVTFSYSKAAPANVTSTVPFRYIPPPGPSVFSKIETQHVCLFVLLVGLITAVIVAVTMVKRVRRKRGYNGYIGKPGGFWDRRRQKSMIKKAAKRKMKEEKKRQKALKKQMKLNKKKRR